MTAKQGKRGPACNCGSLAVIDERRHAEFCVRRLWTERNDLATERDALRDAARKVIMAALAGPVRRRHLDPLVDALAVEVEHDVR
jgi:hypothetical protein